MILQRLVGDIHLEQQGIIVFSGTTQIKLINVYILPESSCTPGYTSSLQHLLELESSVIVGFFNAHHYMGLSNVEETAEAPCWQMECLSQTLVHLTRAPRPEFKMIAKGHQTSRLLVVTCSHVPTGAPKQHSAIFVTFQQQIYKIESKRRTFINLSKATEGYENTLTKPSYWLESTLSQALQIGCIQYSPIE